MTNLPAGWTISALGQLVSSMSNGMPGTQNKDGRGIPVSRIETIADQTVNFSRIGFIEEYEDAALTRFQLRAGDILFSHINSPVHIGKTAIFSSERTLFHGINLLRIQVGLSVCEPRFFNYACKLLRANGTFSLNAQHAVNQSSLNQTKIAAFAIPLAPRAEQRRIADKLDTVLTRVDAVNTRLARVATILKRFRQSVLAAATSGRLTEDWRTDHASLPWSERKYGEISQFHNGYAFKSEIFKSSGDIQIIKLANIKDGSIKLDASPAYVDVQDVSGQILEIPNAGDILIGMTGTKYKRDYGFVCAVPNDIRLLVNQRVGRFVPDKSIVSSKYLMISLMSSDFRDQFFEGETGGVNQGNVGSGHIKNCRISLPSTQEQSEIVRRVETLFAFADRLEARLQTAKTATERLTPALLAKAFRGELVPQDPNDEPASELLRRLQQEAPSTSAKRGRKISA
jgi:type I restriction enzyme S subunit